MPKLQRLELKQTNLFKGVHNFYDRIQMQKDLQTYQHKRLDMEKFIKGQKIQHKNHDDNVYIIVTQDEPARGNIYQDNKLVFNDVELLASQLDEYHEYSSESNEGANPLNALSVKQLTAQYSNLFTSEDELKQFKQANKEDKIAMIDKAQSVAKENSNGGEN